MANFRCCVDRKLGELASKSRKRIQKHGEQIPSGGTGQLGKRLPVLVLLEKGEDSSVALRALQLRPCEAKAPKVGPDVAKEHSKLSGEGKLTLLL